MRLNADTAREGFGHSSLSLGSSARSWWVGRSFRLKRPASGKYSRHGHGGHFTHDPEVAREHAEFAASFMLDRIAATDDQKEQVQAIVGSAVSDLVALAQQHGENHGAWRAELSKPTIDRVALEELRKNGFQLADSASTRLVEALADAAEVLTPEQRSELMEMADRFHNR